MLAPLARRALLPAALLLAAATPAATQILTFEPCVMNGQQVVPPNNAQATGKITFIVETDIKTFNFLFDWKNLSGAPTAVHFHGPAAVGQNGPVIASLKLPITVPSSGHPKVTDAQIADIKAGKWYFDVHTAAFPNGEIRGQLLAKSIIWFDLGSELAGSAGKVPRLAGQGPLTANSANKVTLTNAKPNAQGILFVGLQAINAKFKGGTLVPEPKFTVPFQTDAAGKFELPFHWPANVPFGTNLHWQAWIKDPGGPKGAAASNALRSTAM